MKDNLTAIYSISPRYQRSARIDTDWKNDTATGYVLHETSKNIIRKLCEQTTKSTKNINPQKSFTITGPYGGGKSSLALMISGLVGADTKNKKNYFSLLQSQKDSDYVKNSFGSSKNGWLIVRVIGSRRDPLEAIIDSLEEAILQRWTTRPKSLKFNKKLSLKDFIKYIDTINVELKKSNDGLLIIIDEMGKFLEHAAYDNGDIFIFQEIAENFNRSIHPNIFIGILHQSIGEYAKSLGKVAQNEWNKIQGRFLDLPFSVGIDEVILLISQAINSKADTKVNQKLCTDTEQALKNIGLQISPSLHANLLSCIPLHPLVAFLLGPISRRRFSQNERSIFSFLSSGEPNSLQSFLKKEPLDSTNLFTLDMLWDYLSINLEPTILASPDGHSWSEASEALHRAEKKGSTKHIKLVKALALIEIFAKHYGIRPTTQIIENIFYNDAKKDTKKILDDLSDWSIIIYRQHLSAWGLFSGSDIDIDKLLSESLNNSSMKTNDILNTLPNLAPIIAKEHYYKTGTLRWFEIIIFFSDNLKNYISDYDGLSKNGKFILVLKQYNQSYEELVSQINDAKEYISKNKLNLVIGYSERDKSLIEVAQELSSLNRIKDTNNKIQGDSVARRELNARLSSVYQLLHKNLNDVLIKSTWYFGSSKITEVISLSIIASKIYNQIYSKTPYIKNELINRDKVSGVSVGASKLLLKMMIINSDKQYFSIEGFPPAKSLYLSIFEEKGLHVSKNNSFQLVDPSEADENLKSAWEDAINLIKNNQDKKFSFTQIFNIWRQPPYGIKNGLMPILAMTIYQIHKSKLALFVDDMYFPEVDDYAINRLFNSPDSLSLKYVEVSGIGNDILKKLGAIFSENKSHKNKSVLDVTKKIVQYVLDLKPIVKRTDRMKPETLKFRNAILNGKDPYTILFTDLPEAYGIKVGNKIGDISSKDILKLPNLIKESLDELKGLEFKFDQEIKESVYSALGYDMSEEVDTVKLADRASKIAGISGDFSLESFIGAVIKSKNDPNWIIKLAVIAAEKPLHNWFDLDFDRAKYELYNLMSRFKRVENHVLNTSVGKGVYAISAVTSYEKESPKEINYSIELDKNDIIKVESLTKTIMELINNQHISSDIKFAILSKLLTEANPEIVSSKKGKIN